MKVAFASQDHKRVDAHFGWAKHLLIYEVDANGFQYVQTVQFGGELEEDGNEDKLLPKLEALEDCAILYVAAIGASGAARVVAKKIHPVKVENAPSIEAVLNQLLEVLKGTPPPWLRKALLKGQERVTAFDEEDEQA